MADHSLSFEELGILLAELETVVSSRTEIAVDAELAERARVLEYGSVAGQRPWPHPGQRTVLAIDPESGASVVVSAQAPQGFIRVPAPKFLARLTAALKQPADWLDARAAQEHIAEATKHAVREVLEDVRAAVPRDSGQLAASLRIQG